MSDAPAPPDDGSSPPPGGPDAAGAPDATGAADAMGAPGAPDAPAPAPAEVGAEIHAEVGAEIHAASEPPEPAWVFWPSAETPDAPRIKAFIVATSALFASYTLAALIMRCWMMRDPWSFDGDMPQAVWHYWRYRIPGAFPPGDLSTDYAFVMHAPPGWWLMMSTLSTFFEPITSAKILNVVAYVAGVVAIYVAVGKRSNHFVGLAAAALLVRTLDYWGLIAGGYARSFGPLLVIVFAGAFMLRRHSLCLVILVVQAALYPSVVIPCGLAYGAFTVLAGPTMRERLKRMAGMFVAGIFIIGFGMYQDIQAPKWWGSVVTLAEAKQMPAWGPGGRVNESPLKPWPQELKAHFGRVFSPAGDVVLKRPGAFFQAHSLELIGAVTILSAAAIAVVRQRRRRRGEALVDLPPWQLPLLGVGAVAAYFLARLLAFKLYLPYRPLQHAIPYVLYMAGPLVLWCIFTNTVRRRLVAGALVLGVTVTSSFLLFGDGIQTVVHYQTARPNAKLFTFIRSMPIDVQFGGEIAFVDFIPLLAHHRVLMTRNLAHPFRAGYYQEAERRLRVMYQALYATKLSEVLRISREEKIDAWVYDDSVFTAFDKRLFQPIRSQLIPVFNQNKKLGFALARVPVSAVVYSEGSKKIVDVKKLQAALEADPSLDEPAVAPAFGPQLEGASPPPPSPASSGALPAGTHFQFPLELSPNGSARRVIAPVPRAPAQGADLSAAPASAQP